MDQYPATLSEAAARHIADLRDFVKLAPNTIAGYRTAYSTLIDYLPPTIPWREPLAEQVTAATLEDYFRERVAPLKDSSYENRRSIFVSIIKYMMKRGYIPQGMNFAEDIPPRRKVVKTTRNRRLSDAELLTLLEHAKRSHYRDYYLCLFVRLTGRRISEVLGRSGKGIHGMVWGDVRWDEGVILYDNTKGGKFGQTMPLTPRLRAVLESWREYYCKQLGVDQPLSSWFLFPALTATGPARAGHKRKRVLSPAFRATNPERIIRDLLKSAGLWQSEGDGWHILRKTFGNQRKRTATEMGRADALELTKNSLGHASEGATRIYLDESEERDRYMAWAMEAPELGADAMRAIPELAALATPGMTKPPTSEAEPTASADEVSTNVVDFSAFARGRRALA